MSMGKSSPAGYSTGGPQPSMDQAQQFGQTMPDTMYGTTPGTGAFGPTPGGTGGLGPNPGQPTGMTPVQGQFTNSFSDTTDFVPLGGRTFDQQLQQAAQYDTFGDPFAMPALDPFAITAPYQDPNNPYMEVMPGGYTPTPTPTPTPMPKGGGAAAKMRSLVPAPKPVMKAPQPIGGAVAKRLQQPMPAPKPVAKPIPKVVMPVSRPGRIL